MKTSSLDSSGKVRRRWTFVMLGMASLWSFSAMAQGPCTPIPMPPGQNAAEVAGTAPGHGRDDDPGIQCYSLAVSRGQTVRVRLMGGENVAITIPDVGDARDEFEFVARQDRYEVHVFQLFPGGANEAFRIKIEVRGAQAPMTATTSNPRPVASSTGRMIGAIPSLATLKHNPLGAIRHATEVLAGTDAMGSTPAGMAPSITPHATSLTLDVVGLRLGMSPAEVDRIIRNQTPVGWVYVRDRTKRPTVASTYEWMKGYLAADLSEIVLTYYEPSLDDGVLVAVRRHSMIGKRIAHATVENALVQKYGAPAVTGSNSWVWGRPSGCSTSGTGALGLISLRFIEGTPRSERAFQDVLATGLDLATYGSQGPPDRYARCGPVLAALWAPHNGVMTTLADQHFATTRRAPERFDNAAVAF